MTKEELFAQAKKQRDLQREKEKNKGQGGYSQDYEEIKYVALKEKEYTLLRLLGAPAALRQNEFDAKVINVSTIVGDDDKQFRCIWPTREQNANWILYRIFDLVMKGKWDKESKTRIYDNVKSHPAIFQRVAKNNKIDNTYEKGWKPTPLIVWNCIDRLDMQWHKENKHTKLLSKKVSESTNGDNTMYFYDIGIPPMLYNLIFDELVEFNGDWENYDVVLTKLSDDPYYKVYHATDDYKKKLSTLCPKIKDFIVDEFLTEEEKLWEKYNIDKLFPITSYHKIQKKLGAFIQQVDKTFNKHFTEELEELVLKEAEQNKEKFEKNENEVKKNEVVENKQQTRKPKEVEKEEIKKDENKEFNLNDYVDEFPALETLTDKEKELIIGFDKSKNEFIFKDGLKKSICAQCKNEGIDLEFPDDMNTCPYCGTQY